MTRKVRLTSSIVLNKPMRIILSHSTDPWYNLSMENYLLRSISKDEEVLFLYQNIDSVIMGRFQNPWIECLVEKLEEEGINLIRRQSGGGCVFHDLGNSCFSFISGHKKQNRVQNLELVAQAVSKFGIEIEVNERHDLIKKQNNKIFKVSGSAFKEIKDASFHHGTLLINSDLNKLQKFLNPDRHVMKALGTASVKSPVMNLGPLNPDLNHKTFCNELAQTWIDFKGKSCTIESLESSTHDQVNDIHFKQEVQDFYSNLKSWSWNFGETPKFTLALTHRFQWGAVDLRFDTHKGIVQKAQLFTDAFHPELAGPIGESFNGRPYRGSELKDALEDTLVSFPWMSIEVKDMVQWLECQVP